MKTEIQHTKHLRDTEKVVLSGKVIAVQAYLKKQEYSQVRDLTSHLKELEKEEQIETKVSRRKETVKTKQTKMKQRTEKQQKRLTKLRVCSLKRQTKLTNPQLDQPRKKKQKDPDQHDYE